MLEMTELWGPEKEPNLSWKQVSGVSAPEPQAPSLIHCGIQWPLTPAHSNGFLSGR